MLGGKLTRIVQSLPVITFSLLWGPEVLTHYKLFRKPEFWLTSPLWERWPIRQFFYRCSQLSYPNYHPDSSGINSYLTYRTKFKHHHVVQTKEWSLIYTSSTYIYSGQLYQDTIICSGQLYQDWIDVNCLKREKKILPVLQHIAKRKYITLMKIRKIFIYKQVNILINI